MKRITYLLFALSSFALTSCQKVIDLKIDSANSQYVIEGSITDGPGPYTVRLSKTIGLNSDNNFPAVSNALVIVSDDMGHIDTLRQTDPGHYQTSIIQGKPGHSYNLQVLVDGKSYNAAATMPQPVAIDSIYIARERHMGKEGIHSVVAFKDPANVRNFYRFRIHRNGLATKQLYIMDDQFNDGQRILQSFNDADSNYAGNDNIQIELQGISEELYLYYSSLQQTLMQSAASPANPIRQIKGGDVLGYFSAYTVSAKNVIVP